jgi:3-polyprenyl-4-hydroxybenzoate decarboxylase
MTANMRPKIVIVVDPDIDVHDPVQVDWACAFRMQPARDMIVVDALPGGTLDPTTDRSLPLDRQTGSVVGIDATFPFGAEIRTAGARPVSRDICGPALAEKGHEYIEVADVPGWREYEFPELKGEKR